MNTYQIVTNDKPSVWAIAKHTEGSNVIELPPLRYHTHDATMSAWFALNRALKGETLTATASR